ncbi:MAG: globin domain-containing protein [Bacteroidota bacterium]
MTLLMTQQEIQLVQESVTELMPRTQQMGEALYARLFEIAPELKALFKTDIPQQSRKLMSIIIHVIANLDQMDHLEEELQDLSAKHSTYNITASDYEVLKEAFLWTFAQEMGENWTDELSKAWAAAYDILAKVMMEAKD